MISNIEQPTVKVKPANGLQTNPPCQPTSKKRVAQLIGKRCMVHCFINDVPLEMLLDSGAQVMMVNREWIEKALPCVKIQSLQSLFNNQSLEISAANGTEVPLDGWAEVDLRIGNQNHGYVTIRVPLLICKNCNGPLLGCNVITEVIKANVDNSNETDVTAILKDALSVTENTVEALVSALHITASDETPLCNVRIGKKGVTIPAGKIYEVKCRVREWPGNITRLFQPCPEIN